MTSRTIVYAAIGAALYGVLRVVQFPIPGTSNVSIRPAFALVPFFGYAFGPIVGFFTGFVGNAIGRPDLRLGRPDVLELEHRERPRRPHRRPRPDLRSACGHGSNKIVHRRRRRRRVATIIGFLFVFTDIWVFGTDSVDRS